MTETPIFDQLAAVLDMNDPDGFEPSSNGWQRGSEYEAGPVHQYGFDYRDARDRGTGRHSA
jgi:hypothetical protein